MADATAADPCRIFVGNLPWSVDNDALTAWASGIGAVDNVHVVMSREGRSRGRGYVTFVDEASATRAKNEFNGTMLDERELKIEAALPPRPRTERRPAGDDAAPGEPTNRMFVGNLPFETDNDGLRAAIGAAAGITDVSVSTRANGSSRGWGYVTFGTPEEVAAAVAALGEVAIGDRTLRLEPENGARTRRRAGAGGAGGAGGRRRRAADDDAEYKIESDPTKCFIGNLPWSTTSDELKAAFPGAVGAEIAMTRDGSRSRGFGYVTFADEGAAAAAATGAAPTLGDRELRVEAEKRKVRV